MMNIASTDMCLYKQWSDKANVHLNTLTFIICLVPFMKAVEVFFASAFLRTLNLISRHLVS